MKRSKSHKKPNQGEIAKDGIDEYLKVLEEVKLQYQQYLEVSGIFELPPINKQNELEYLPPTPKNPLTTNTFRGN